MIFSFSRKFKKCIFVATLVEKLRFWLQKEILTNDWTQKKDTKRRILQMTGPKKNIKRENFTYHWTQNYIKKRILQMTGPKKDIKKREFYK
jgi:hypothetical protein